MEEKFQSRIEIVRYSSEHKPLWDEFVESSKNGTFLFKRDYMDYHSERFRDNSFLIYRKEKLYCLLPANINDGVLYSHQGLTYGGLVMNDRCSVEGVMDVFSALATQFREAGIGKMVYKPIPHIYHKLPAEEDLYSLFRNNARLTVRNVSSTIKLPSPLRMNKDRREAVRRAERNGLTVKKTSDYEAFWRILEENLRVTYNSSPVHTLEEFLSLREKFPENIKLWGAFEEGELLGGVVCYYMPTLVHAQYISATPEGKKRGAIDLIVSSLIGNIEGKSYFDLGTSNGDGGRYLNESLIYQKEGFGGRAVCYDTYEMLIN